MIVKGSEHLIMPKKVLLFTLLAASSVIGGVLFSNRLYARKVEAFLASKTKAVKRRNKNLEQERAEYRDLFEKLTNQLDQAADKSSERELTKESAGSFNQLATVRYPVFPCRRILCSRPLLIVAAIVGGLANDARPS